MTIVFWKRYPEDSVSSRAFDSDFDAEQFYRNKQEDYRYLTGSVWTKRYEED